MKPKLGHWAMIGAAAVSAALIATSAISAPALGPDRRGTARGPGGCEIILEPYPGSGSVLVAAAVTAGSAYETPETRGVTHLLEHLLFDGSERFTREEISSWVDDNGAFLNAFTRKEVTVYFLLARADLLEESIEILSQMLLHPVFSADELEKERKVVLEEMNKAMDDPREAFSRMADSYLYRGSPLAEPVIGYPATIESVSREGIVEYYRRHYRPERMRIFLMGDYERETALGWIGDYFSTGAGVGGKAGRGGVEGAPEPRWGGEVTRRVMEDSDGRVELMVRMPSPGDGLFPAAIVLAQILGSRSSPLEGAAEKAGMPNPDVSLEVHSSFSALRISLDSPTDGADPEGLIGLVKGLSDWRPGEKDLETAKTGLVSSEIFDRERYHFYLMLHGEALALTGRGWFDAVSAAGDVRPAQIGQIVERYIAEPMFNCFAATALAPDVRIERREAVFASLPGGLTAAVRSREGAEVEALCLLFPGRACAAGDGGPAWIPSALHTVLENSAEGTTLDELLAAEGARLQWGDNPFIPMDDYLVNPSWSFIRLETPAGSMRAAAALLADFLVNYRIDGSDLEGAVPAITRESAARQGQSSAALEEAVYKGLFGGHPYGARLFPPPGAAAGIDPSMLGRVGGELHRSKGSVVALVSPMAEGAAMGMLQELFGDYGATGSTVCPRDPGPAAKGLVEGTSPGGSAYLAAAWRLDGLSPQERAALAVACEALSRRMQLDIRETRGLAYSTGCSMSEVGEYTVVTASLGTRAENAEEASKALREDIEGLVVKSLTPAEAATAKSRLVSRLSRRELSCAGEALGIGLDHLMGGGEDRLRLIVSAPFEGVVKAAGALEWPQALFVRLEPAEGASEKKSMPAGMMRR